MSSPKINPTKAIQKHRSEEEMRNALAEMVHGVHVRNVPPQVDDSDIILQDAIAELLHLRQQVEDVRGWMSTWLAKDTKR